MRAVCCVLLLVGCGEPTYYPTEPEVPAYGDAYAFWVCAEFGQTVETLSFEVTNLSARDAELVQIDRECNVAGLQDLKAGETLKVDAPGGTAWAVGDPEFHYLLDNWLFTLEGEPAVVEVQ